MRTLTSHTTLLEAVRKSLEQAGRSAPGDAIAPAALLWCDPEGEWKACVSLLYPHLPQLHLLGEYDPEKRTGPAIWLRCVIERTLTDVELSAEKTPILYLPHVSRQTLRAGDDCPGLLKPLVELQYRGTLWMQRNGRDWSVEAFLSAADGMELDVAKDQHTHTAMLGALAQLAMVPVSHLWGRRLQAADFDRLLSEDTPRDLLTWLNDPDTIRDSWADSRWSAFCSRSKAEYGFDPQKDGPLTAAEKLGLQSEEKWIGVWTRFKESPAMYRNLGDLLRRAKPAGQLLFNKEPWPDENAREEASLRQALLDFETLNPQQARQKTVELEEQHGLRRQWVWAKLGECNLAVALASLHQLAQSTATLPAGSTIMEMSTAYTETGYKTDSAVWQALAAVSSTEDKRAITNAIRTLYLPWLESCARHFQALLSSAPSSGTPASEPSGQACWLFVDGLRYDLARRLEEILIERQCSVVLTSRWAALPTVTATAKPAVSPVAEALAGDDLGETFIPIIRATGQPLTGDRFEKLLTERGFAVLENDDVGDPAAGSQVWTEWGHFDRLGHDLGAGLVWHIEEQLVLLAQRIEDLLQAGWQSVRLVTDHGWLLLPGGFPKIDLPKYLVANRWARCAAVREGAHYEMPVAHWHWNPAASFVHPPDVHCFTKGNEYAHGGVSLQECLIPEMTVVMEKSTAPVLVTIRSHEWRGLRCRIQIDPLPGLRADLRTKPYDPASSITNEKEIDADGSVALLVADESLEGAVASLVICNAAGEILARQMTTVGGKE